MGDACSMCEGRRDVRIPGRPANERMPCPRCGGTGTQRPRVSNLAAYRYRRLTDDQAIAIRAAAELGVPKGDLAREYRVSARTIFRTIARASEDVVELRAGEYRAQFALTDVGPVQLSPWFPADG